MLTDDGLMPTTVPDAALHAWPRLSAASAPLTREVEVLDEYGQRRTLHRS